MVSLGIPSSISAFEINDNVLKAEILAKGNINHSVARWCLMILI
jgi:hypothetical protein